MHPSVSIILPCYNVAPYLDVCLNSLVNQTLQDIEIICVNDGSMDDTPSLLNAWALKDSRVHVFNRKNGGQAAARNDGMDWAQGEYIGFVDPDDYVEHSMYARLLEEARRYDADVAVCGYTGFSDSDEAVLEEWSLSPDAGVEENMKESPFQWNALWMQADVVVWNKLYRNDFLRKNRLRFEPSFRSVEDDVFWMMLLPHVTRLAVIPDRLYWYRRQRKGSVSSFCGKDGTSFLVVLERLEYATMYWKKAGWWESGVSLGWVSHVLQHYLLAHLMSMNHPLPSLDEQEWALFRNKCRKWFSMVGDTDVFCNLGKWDYAFCRLLACPPERAGPLSLAWWNLLSHCRGRRGRYYVMRRKLALAAAEASRLQTEDTGVPLNKKL